MAYKQYCLGIDSGEKTGMALYCRKRKKMVDLRTVDFWQSITYLMELQIDIGRDNLEIFVEDSEYHKGLYAKRKYGNSMAVQIKISEGVGRNKQDNRRLKQWLELNHIPFRAVIPGRESCTKMDQITFKKLTGWAESSNEHERDAALLVWGR
jgi:hypothetical protein